MEFNKNTSSGITSVMGLIIKSIFGLLAIICLVFFLNKIDFPSPKKEIFLNRHHNKINSKLIKIVGLHLTKVN